MVQLIKIVKIALNCRRIYNYKAIYASSDSSNYI